MIIHISVVYLEMVAAKHEIAITFQRVSDKPLKHESVTPIRFPESYFIVSLLP